MGGPRQVLEKIKVRNYQSLEDVDLILGTMTVIIGASGSGKSSLIRALKALVFNQTGDRFIRHGQQKTSVILTFDDGKTVEWEKTRGKSATYDANGVLYTRTGTKVPSEIEEALGIRRIEIDKGLSFTPQFHSQHDAPLLLTESSTLAARALAKLTKLSILVEAQMDCRRDGRRAGQQHTAAEEEAERTKEQLAALPSVKRAKNVLERAAKVMRNTADKLATARQADDIVQDISGALLVADLTLARPEELEEMQERIDEVSRMVLAVTDFEHAALDLDDAGDTEEEAEGDLASEEVTYKLLIEELGACPMCGSTESWGHDHD